MAVGKKRKTKTQVLVQILKSPSFIMLGISMIILAIQIIAIGRIRPFNSDDIYWQLVAKTWVPFNGDTLYLATKDIFIEQVPFFYLTQHFFEPSRKLVIFETLALTFSAFTMCYVSTLYFLRKLNIKPTYLILLPFVWLASFGYPLVQNYLNTDWRTFEVGISFITFTLVAAYLFGDINPFRSIKTKILLTVFIVFMGVMNYSDPYFVFFTVMPIALFAGTLYLLKKIDLRKLGTVVGGTLLSLAMAKVVSWVAEKAGVVIVTDTPSAFVNFDHILTNIVSSLHGLLIVFGGDFFGRSAFAASTIAAMLNALLLGIIIVGVLQLRKVLRAPTASRLTLAQLWGMFFGLLVAFVFVVYTSTTLVLVSNYRFFIILVYAAITFMVITLGLSRNQVFRLAVGALLIAATATNLAITTTTENTKGQVDVGSNVGNSLNFEIINAVRKEGLTKGYTTYWHGNINTYLAKNQITFLPSLCVGGETQQFRWLVDGAQYNRPAERSFYLIDPAYKAPPNCDEEQLSKQYGKPEKTLTVRDKTILIYSYDITSKTSNFTAFDH